MSDVLRFAIERGRVYLVGPTRQQPSVTLAGEHGRVSVPVESTATRMTSRYFPRMVDSDDDEEGWTTERIDAEFPLGDGDADTDAFVECPYCGEVNEISLDPGSGADQEYTEDCQVCCRAWLVRVRYGRDGTAEVELGRGDE
jgi:hypothetical protein